MQKGEKNIITFLDIKEELLREVNKKIPNSGISESVSLVDGFINQPISMELSSSIVLGGPVVPMIMLVGNNSGRIYLFALKVLIPDYDQKNKSI